MAKEKTTTEEEVTKKSSKKEVSRIIFTIKDRDEKNGVATRVFDEDTHGEDFKDVADSFAEAEKNQILSRTDE